MTERVSTWAYRLLALAIALALWYVTAAEKREAQSEKIVEATVTYSTPARLVLLNQVTQVRVGLRGNNREIRRLRPYDVDVQVDLATAEEGPVSVTLTADNVFLPVDKVEVVSIDPKTLSLRLDVEEQRRLPIEVLLTGEPAAGAIVTDREAIPNTALLQGPRSVLQALDSLIIGPVDLNGHAITFEKEMPVLTPNTMIRVVRPTVVTIRITMEEPPPPNGGSRR